MRFFLLILTIAWIICSCNTKSHNDQQNVWADTIVKIEPQKFKESIKDTLIDSLRNLKVIVRTSSRMDKFADQVYQKDSLHYVNTKYRDNQINVKVLIGDTVKFDTTILKEKLVQIGDDDFMRQSILHKAWINSYDKESGEIVLGFNVVVPDTDWAYNFTLHVYKNWKSDLLLEEIE